MKNSYLWVEKYKPDGLEQLIGNNELKESLASYIEKNDIPHLLFHGNTPGTGKTSAAHILVNSIPCDYLWINASIENGIDTVRDKVINFASTMGFQDLKIIVLDEFDYFSHNAMASLRGVIEQYQESVRFIFTANYIDKILEAIVSRCQVFHVVPPSQREVATHLMYILGEENVNYEVSAIKKLLDIYYPDIRKLIGECQLHSNGGQLSVDSMVLSSDNFKEEIIKILSSPGSTDSRLTNIRQALADSGYIDYIGVYRSLYGNVTQIYPSKVPDAILIISDGLYKDSSVVDHEINLCATLIQLMRL